MTRRIFALLLLGALHLYGGIAELERFIEEEVTDASPPSVSLAVLLGDEIIYEKSFGFSDPDRKHPTTPHSVYNLYSLSKIVTATAVMQLVEEGRITLDDPLRRYFPRFKTLYRGEAREVTVAELLNHSSGVTDRSGDYRHLFNDARYEMLLAQGKQPAEQYELDYEPGSEAQYSNSEYIILGYLIEKVTGHSFESVVKEKILDRVGMQESGFAFPDVKEGDEVFGSLRFFSWMGQAMRLMISDADKLRYEGTMLWLKRYDVRWSPAGGLKGSLHDMARFLQATHRLELYNVDTYRSLLFTPPVDVDTTFSKFDRVRFGYGWYHLEADGDMFYQHQGIGPGFRNIMRMYPGYDLSFVILTNQSGTDIDAWAERVFNTFKEEIE